MHQRGCLIQYSRPGMLSSGRLKHLLCLSCQRLRQVSAPALVQRVCVSVCECPLDGCRPSLRSTCHMTRPRLSGLMFLLLSPRGLLMFSDTSSHNCPPPHTHTQAVTPRLSLSIQHQLLLHLLLSGSSVALWLLKYSEPSPASRWGGAKSSYNRLEANRAEQIGDVV